MDLKEVKCVLNCSCAATKLTKVLQQRRKNKTKLFTTAENHICAAVPLQPVLPAEVSL